jgi:hypothetical protein
LEPIGLEASDLFEHREQRDGDADRMADAERHEHVYKDADGVPVARKVRLVRGGMTAKWPEGGKAIWWEYPHNGAWCTVKNLPPGAPHDPPRMLYGLPEVVAAIREGRTVYAVEGEKCADALVELGLTATTSPAGASKGEPKWLPEHAEQLRGASAVRVLADDDDQGVAHAEATAHTTWGVGVRDLRVLQFKGQLRPDGARGGGDVSDWIHEEQRLRGRAPEMIREILVGLVEAAPEWRPSVSENDSAATRDGVPAETNLPFRTALELCAQAPEEVPWIVPGYVPRGALVELDGKVKAGKTTFLAAMVRQVLDGGTFLGNLVERGKVVWLTEQPTTSFADALRGAGLEDRDDLLLLQWTDARGLPWEKVARAATAKAQEVRAILLLVDTLGQFAGIRGDGENSAGEAQRSIEPLQVAAAAGLGVVVCRHERKSGGGIGDSARGSSAWSGAVDVILQLRRPDGAQRETIRVLGAVGRFRETPAEQVIEMRDGLYHALGTQQDVAGQEAREKILKECPTEPANALTLSELVERLKLKRTTCQIAADSLVGSGLLGRTGEGKRGKPWRYFRAGEKGFCQNPIPKQTVPAETNPSPKKDSARTPAGSGRMNPAPIAGPSPGHSESNGATPELESLRDVLAGGQP